MNTVQAACVFNRPSFDKFVPKIRPGGLLIVNSSLINVTTDRTDITEILVPANKMAMEGGNARAANIVMLGAFVGATGIVDPAKVRSIIKDKLGKKKDMLDLNLKMLKKGLQIAEESIGKAPKK